MALHVMEEANRCLGCKVPQCQKGCPIATPIPEVIKLLKAGELDQAGRMLFENNPLTTVCSLICNHEGQCEGHCVLGRKGTPVHFSVIENYISSTYASKMVKGPAPSNGMKVAIVGSTDRRFSEDSILAVYESDDGLRYTRVNNIKVNTGWMCHNCGISGDAQHHIKSGDTLLLAYAYGNKWGCWGTRIHDYSFEAMEEDFYDESDLQNLHHEIEKIDDPTEFSPSMLYLRKPHFRRLTVGETLEIPMMTGNVTYSMRPVEGKVTYFDYDPAILSIENGKATGVSEGYTYVRAAYNGLFCEFLAYVDNTRPHVDPDWKPHPEKTVTSFTPLITKYAASLAKREMKQLRGLAVYEDGTWFEVCGDDGVTYENHSPELIEIRPDGNVLPLGEQGEGRVTLKLGDFAFDVTFTVGE